VFRGLAAAVLPPSHAERYARLQKVLGHLLAQQKFTLQGAPSQTCLADSGAPALDEEDGVEYVVGVSSSGDAHCQEHAQAVRVDAFADDFILPAIDESARSYGCQQVPDRAPGLSFPVLTLVLLQAAARRKRGPARH